MSCQGNHLSTSGLLIDSKAPVNAVATVRTHDQSTTSRRVLPFLVLELVFFTATSRSDSIGFIGLKHICLISILHCFVIIILQVN